MMAKFQTLCVHFGEAFRLTLKRLQAFYSAVLNKRLYVNYQGGEMGRTS